MSKFPLNATFNIRVHCSGLMPFKDTTKHEISMEHRSAKQMLPPNHHKEMESTMIPPEKEAGVQDCAMKVQSKEMIQKLSLEKAPH